jgi:hypothetical protein
LPGWLRRTFAEIIEIDLQDRQRTDRVDTNVQYNRFSRPHSRSLNDRLREKPRAGKDSVENIVETVVADAILRKRFGRDLTAANTDTEKFPLMRQADGGLIWAEFAQAADSLWHNCCAFAQVGSEQLS